MNTEPNSDQDFMASSKFFDKSPRATGYESADVFPDDECSFFVNRLRTEGMSTTTIDLFERDLRFQDNEALFLQFVDLLVLGQNEKSKILEALVIAKRAHEGQIQKRPQDETGVNVPYVNHPIQVALMGLTDLKLSAEAVQGALLHDVIEDTNCTGDQLAAKFSPHVMSILEDVTRNKGESKSDFSSRIDRLEEGDSGHIKCLDRLHNLIRSFTIDDVEYLKFYVKESEEVYLPKFEKFKKLQPLLGRFQGLLADMKKRINVLSAQDKSTERISN